MVWGCAAWDTVKCALFNSRAFRGFPERVNGNCIANLWLPSGFSQRGDMEEIFHSIRSGKSEALLAVPLGYCRFVCYWHTMGNIDLYGRRFFRNINETS